VGTNLLGNVMIKSCNPLGNGRNGKVGQPSRECYDQRDCLTRTKVGVIINATFEDITHITNLR